MLPLTKDPTKITSEEWNILGDIKIPLYGTKDLGEIYSDISAGINNEDNSTSLNIANYIGYYCTLNVMRHLMLTSYLLILRSTETHYPNFIEGIQNHIEKDRKTDYERFKIFGELPTNKNYNIYKHIHLSLSKNQKEMILSYFKYIGVQFKGDLCLIKHIGMNQYVIRKDGNSPFSAYCSGLSKQGIFRIFREDNFIYNVEYGEYVVAPLYTEFSNNFFFNTAPDHNFHNRDMFVDWNSTNNTDPVQIYITNITFDKTGKNRKLSVYSQQGPGGVIGPPCFNYYGQDPQLKITKYSHFALPEFMEIYGSLAPYPDSRARITSADTQRKKKKFESVFNYLPHNRSITYTT